MENVKELLEKTSLVNVSYLIRNNSLNEPIAPTDYVELQRKLLIDIEKAICDKFEPSEAKQLLKDIKDYSMYGDNLNFYYGIKGGANLLKELVNL